MADNKPTFHHLNHSQSQRIFWLLEELGIEYNLVLHERNPSNHPTAPFRSPPSLLATGPQGKSPLLISGAKDGNRYIPETYAIATYLIRTFDTEDKFGLRNGDWIRDDILTSMSVANLNRAQGFALYLDFGIITAGEGPRGDGVKGAELKKYLADVEEMLKEGPPGGYFLGEHPGRADIILEWPIAYCKARPWWADLKKEYPLLDAWLERVHNRPAFKRSLEKGNGYDPSIFPHPARG